MKIIPSLALTILLTIAPTLARGGVLYSSPPGGWAYLYDGAGDAYGDNVADVIGNNALDGNWTHRNGSDSWADEATLTPDRPGTGNGLPGGVGSLTQPDPRSPGGTVTFLRMVDAVTAGNTTTDNRRFYFMRNLATLPGYTATFMDSGVTISFRARLVPDAELEGPANATNKGGMVGGDGKGMFGFRQASGDQIVTFSLHTANEDGTPTPAFASAGLTLNKNLGDGGNRGQVGNPSSGTVAHNDLALNPDVWHEVWVTVQANDATPNNGTHTATVYLDGYTTPAGVFNFTAGSGDEGTSTSPVIGDYLELGQNFTPLVGAFDTDFYAVAFGVHPPAPVNAITVTTTDNASPPGDGQTSLLEALQTATEGSTIAFNIPGPGPHVIVTPIGGYPLISNHNITIDGYSQPGSSPNTNPILGGNNAQIKIVLDSTGTDSAPNPGNPARPLRRSTRLDFPDLVGNTGYGETENCILGVFAADNVTIRGLSFIARHTAGSEGDPSIFGVALINQATNAHVNGCWFGLAPGGSTMADVKPAASAVAAFRWRIGGDVYSEGLRFGTDGNGISDRAEFNVALGSRIALALELPRAKVSGNYLNVFPDGLTFVDVDAIYATLFALGGGDSVENFENGRQTDDTVIGTDGDGMSDADEGNIMGHAVYSHDIEFYSNANGAVVAGNHFGVGIDGVTPAMVPTNRIPDFISLPGTASVRIGSDGDGVSDALEANLIVNVPGDNYVDASLSVLILTRRNRMVNNQFQGVPFVNGEGGRFFGAYYATVLADPAAAKPVIRNYTNGHINVVMGVPSATYSNTVVELYVVDPAVLWNQSPLTPLFVHPQTLLGTYTDNGAGDLEPVANELTLDLSGFGLASNTYVAVAVSYSTNAGTFEAGGSVTSPMSNPVAARPTVRIERADASNVKLSWIAPENAFALYGNENLFNPLGWTPVTGAVTYSDGLNSVTTQIDTFGNGLFFRVQSQ